MDNIKYLGVTITNDLKWNTHISNICTKATPTENFEYRHLVCHPKGIVNTIKNTEFVRSSDEKNTKTHESEHSSNTRVLRAKQLVEQDHISFSPKLGAFTIMDTKSLYTVRLFPTESCTCPLRKSCIHILSVKLGMRMTLKQNDYEHQNIGVVRKNERTTSLKPGRKRPRPGDISPKKSVENTVKHGKLVEAEQPFMVKEGEAVKKLSLIEEVEIGEQLSATVEENAEQSSLKIQKDTDEQPEEDWQELSLLLQQMSQDKSLLNDLTKQIKKEEQEQDVSFENIISSTPKSELEKDIKYSKGLWVKSDGEKLRYDLNVNDRAILQSRKWLNDTLIDASMNLLKYQFPDLEGFETCHLAAQLDFEKHDKLFIQIINRSTQDGGSHWITVSNIKCMQDEVTVYDSSYSDLSDAQAEIVASLIRPVGNLIKVKMSNVYLQINGYDCGLYAIDNATSLAYGRDPSTQSYVPRMMRQHLIGCFENRNIKPFPTATGKRRKSIKKVIDLPVYCICKMPDTHTVYVYCDNCSNEYHPECVGLKGSIHESLAFICSNCTDNQI